MSLLTKALAAGVSAAFLVACAANGDDTASGGSTASGDNTVKTKAQISLPPLTGQHQVGTTDIHLVDQARQDPWKPDRKREIMISIWYPAKDIAGRAQQPWTSAGGQADVEKLVGSAGVPKGSVDWTATKTAGYVDAPREDGKWPVVLYSPGLAGQRTMGTVLVQDLASHGYIVVTVDHTFEATVEFPGGRVEAPVDVPKEKLPTAAAARMGDIKFVLDELAKRGENLDKVGMFGHSFGGFTTAQSMLLDKRIDAGADLDGQLFPDLGDVAKTGLDRPFFLYGRQQNTEGGAVVDHSPTTSFDPSWGQFWANQKGPKQSAVLTGGRHMSFTDMQVVAPQLTKPLNLPADRWVSAIGTIDPAESIKAQSTAVLGFFQSSLS